MSKFLSIKTTNGTRISINIDFITNYRKVSQELTYIDFYSVDRDIDAPYIIERIETSMSYDNVTNRIIEIEAINQK